MKNYVVKLSFLVLVGVVMGLPGQVYAEPILIDLGNEFSYRGFTTPDPDDNGKYWNSVWSGAFYTDLVDINGNATEVDLGFSSVSGTDSYNGPAGPTDIGTPAEILAAVDIDAAALGNLGAKEAAVDYYVSSAFEIQGLDPMKTYNLTFYGSHKFSPSDTSVYSVYTDNSHSVLVDSVSLQIQDSDSPWLHNRDTVAVLQYVSPQPDNIIYIAFSGYLNSMQIEEAPSVIPVLPGPSNGATEVDLTANLSWYNPQDYVPSKYVLSFVADEPNWIAATVVDPVVDLDQDGDPMTTEAAMPISIDNNTTYYWKVQSFRDNDPNEYITPVWSFTTVSSLTVEAGMNVLTWLEGGAIVDLKGSIDCNCDPADVLWSVVDKPDGSTVYIAEETSAVTWASFDTVGPYTLMLWAQDDSVPPLENEDTIEVRVFDNACLAAQGNPAGHTPLLHDFNNDCRLDLEDFANFAAEWLTDYALEDNLEY